MPKISAAVAQEEAAATVEEEAEAEAEAAAPGDSAEHQALLWESSIQLRQCSVSWDHSRICKPRDGRGKLVPLESYITKISQFYDQIHSKKILVWFQVLHDRDTRRSRGFAFVTMSSVADCEAVIQNLDGSVRISLQNVLSKICCI